MDVATRLDKDARREIRREILSYRTFQVGEPFKALKAPPTSVEWLLLYSSSVTPF